MKNFEIILKNEGFSDLFNQSLMESIILFIDKDVNTQLEFERNYNLRYIGEIAERWQERNIVKSEKDLIGLIIGLSFANDDDSFLYNQKSIFVESVLNYIQNNSIKNTFLIKIALSNFIYRQDVESTEGHCKKLIDDLLIESKSLEKKEYFLELILFDDCKISAKMVDKLTEYKSIIKNILHFAIFDLKKVDIEILIKFLLCYFKTKDVNICNYDLKINEFKDNKLAIQKIKLLYKLVFSELKDTKIQEYKDVLELNEYVLLYINYFFKDNLYNPAKDRIKKLYIYYFLKFGKLEEKKYYCVLKDIIGTGYIYGDKKYFSYASKYFDQINDDDLFVAMCEDLIPNFELNTYSKIINSNKLDLLSKRCKETILENILLYPLNKDDFDKAYMYLEKNEISIDLVKRQDKLDSNFVFNLFEYNKIDVYDFEFIKEKKLIEYLFNYYSKTNIIQKYLLLNIFPIESLNSNEINFYTYYLSDILSKISSNITILNNHDMEKIIEKYNLRNINNSDLDDELLIKRSFINCYLNSLNFVSPNEFISSMYNIYNEKSFIDIMQWSEKEILEVNKLLFDYKLVKDDIYNELKKIFISEDELYKEKINNLCIYLESKNISLKNTFGCLNLKTFFIDNKKDIEKNKNLLNKFINSLKFLLTSDKENIRLQEVTELYFHIINSNIINEYKENIFNYINNYFIETTNK